VLGGLTAAALDILDAFAVSILNGRSPVRVLHAIAGGLLGPRAAQGGAPAAGLGLGLHFLIAIGAATTYFLASRRLPVLLRTAGVMPGWHSGRWPGPSCTTSCFPSPSASPTPFLRGCS
jgi:hypothetical protein